MLVPFTGGASQSEVNLSHLKLASAKILLLAEYRNLAVSYKQAYQLRTEQLRYTDSIVHHTRLLLIQEKLANDKLTADTKRLHKQRDRLIISNGSFLIILVIILIL